MPQLQPIPLATQSAEAQSKFSTKERLINFYAEAGAQASKGPAVLYPTPGLSPWATVGDGPIRGMHRMGNKLYVISGDKAYVVNAAAVATEIGTIEGTGTVHMTDNGTHVAVCHHQQSVRR